MKIGWIILISIIVLGTIRNLMTKDKKSKKDFNDKITYGLLYVIVGLVLGVMIISAFLPEPLNSKFAQSISHFILDDLF